jgi:hypothetical protein
MHIGVLALALAFAAGAAACSKDKKPDDGKQDETEDKDEPVEDESSLWRLAPPDAAMGFVVQPGAIASLHEGMVEVRRVVEADPLLAKVFAEMHAEAMKDAPADFLDIDAVKKLGIDPKLGFAVFLDAEDDVIAGTLPFASLEALAKIDDKKITEVDGRKVMKDDDGDLCTMAAGYVMCGRDLATIDAAAKGTGTLAKSFPPELRGDLEFLVDASKMTGLKVALEEKLFKDVGYLAFSARKQDGVVALRLAVQGTLAVSVAGNTGLLPKSFEGADRGAVGVFRMRLSLQPLIALTPMPAEMPLPDGTDIRRDLVDQLTGDLIAVTRGGGGVGGVEIGIGLKDPAPVTKVLPSICRALAAQIVPGTNVRPVPGGCEGSTRIPDADRIPAPLLPGGADVFAWKAAVRDDALWITVGNTEVAADAPGASKHTAELFAADAHITGWGRSLDPLAALDEPSRKSIVDLIASAGRDDSAAIVRAVRWSLAHVAEIGFSLHFGDGWVQTNLIIATHAADPADVYAAYEAALRKDLDGDYAGYRAAMKSLAGKPDTLAGRQARIVDIGAPPLGFGAGVGAAIAIPAFLKYQEKSQAFRAIREQLE